MKISLHRFSSSLFADFCAGPAPGSVMAVLRSTQLSHRKLSLLTLADTAMAEETGDLRAEFERAWHLLADAERAEASVVEELLLHPSVGVWLARALRAAVGDRLSLAELGYLSSVAAAAAIRCGIPCALSVPVVHGAVTLPTVGQVSLPGGFTAETVEVTVSGSGTVGLSGWDERLPVDRATRGGAIGFEPVKTIDCRRDGIRLRAELDDQGPYREFSDPIPPRPLDPAEVRAWETQIAAAWDVLVAQYRGFAEELSRGISVIVPFGPWSKAAGASSVAAYGAIAVSRRKSAFELAEALIHETQHSKLNALFEFADLVAPESDWLGYAPWRHDPRPAAGLLHGVLAFTTAVEFWRGQRGPDTPAARTADFHYAYWRWQVRHTIDGLAAAGDLTGLGRRFVRLLSERLDRVEHDEVPGDVLDAVAGMTAEHRAFWRAQHLRPDSGQVTALAEAWAAGEAPPAMPSAPDDVVPCRRSLRPSPRIGMLKRLLLDGIDPAEEGSASAADVAYVLGDTKSARDAYEEEIRSDPRDDRAWLAFGLATGRGNALADAPGVVLAVRDRLLAGGTSIGEPAKLIAWLDDALAGTR